MADGVPKKKKKRLSSYRIKKFAEIYQSTDEYLGQGACGTVRTFFSVEKRKEFAVKIIRNTSTRVRSKVLKEIEILHHCKGHENIVQLQEFYEEDQNFYLVFEKMSGGTMLERLTRDGPLPELDVSKVVGGLASALKFLHDRSVAHRDLKLENILCSAPGDSSSSSSYNQDGNLSGLHPVKLCDFDLSTEFSGLRVVGGKNNNDGSSWAGSRCWADDEGCGGSLSSSPLLNFASAVGSIDYMAPEVVSVWLYESDQYTEQCDLWSLGVVMFILLSGLKPIVARRPHNCVCRDSNYEYICDYCREEHFEEIKRGRYDMSGPEWSSISEGAKDLIRSLLVVDPTKRLTAQQVLAHPWIVDPLSHLRIPDPLVHPLSVVDPSRTRMSAPVPIPCSPSTMRKMKADRRKKKEEKKKKKNGAKDGRKKMMMMEMMMVKDDNMNMGGMVGNEMMMMMTTTTMMMTFKDDDDGKMRKKKKNDVVIIGSSNNNDVIKKNKDSSWYCGSEEGDNDDLDDDDDDEDADDGGADYDDDDEHWLFVDHNIFIMDFNDDDEDENETCTNHYQFGKFHAKNKTKSKIDKLTEKRGAVVCCRDVPGDDLCEVYHRDVGCLVLDSKNSCTADETVSRLDVDVCYVCAMKMLRFGSCDSGNISGVSPLGSPVKF